MLDQAGIRMAQGNSIACERICGVNDNMIKSHYHNYYEIYYLEEGERYDMYLLRPGEMILFSPYILHRSYGDENVPFKRIVLYFQSDEINCQELSKALDYGNGVYKPQLKIRPTIHRILEELLIESDTTSEFVRGYRHTLVNALLFVMMMQTQKQNPRRQEKLNRMSQIINYIHMHYHEDILLEEIAKTFFISPYHLCREFKRYTNSTVVQYVNITRIMNAQRKFMETDKNITEISKETGFSNITHFNRVFKAVTGMTPSGYRKTHRNLVGGYD